VDCKRNQKCDQVHGPFGETRRFTHLLKLGMNWRFPSLKNEIQLGAGTSLYLEAGELPGPARTTQKLAPPLHAPGVYVPVEKCPIRVRSDALQSGNAVSRPVCRKDPLAIESSLHGESEPIPRQRGYN
jgi:hypothetical protein